MNSIFTCVGGPTPPRRKPTPASKSWRSLPPLHSDYGANLLHVPIDHFAEVNLIGFYDIAAALGPLEV
ncbi:hypothetical protein R3Q06_36750, partial [Rhodococcus erythropolis]